MFNIFVPLIPAGMKRLARCTPTKGSFTPHRSSQGQGLSDSRQEILCAVLYWLWNKTTCISEMEIKNEATSYTKLSSCSLVGAAWAQPFVGDIPLMRSGTTLHGNLISSKLQKLWNWNYWFDWGGKIQKLFLSLNFKLCLLDSVLASRKESIS